MNGMVSSPGKAPYSATKAGVIGLTKVKTLICSTIGCDGNP